MQVIRSDRQRSSTDWRERTATPRPGIAARRGMRIAMVLLLALLCAATASAEPGPAGASFAARYAAVDRPGEAVPAGAKDLPPAGPPKAAKSEAPVDHADAQSFYRALIGREAAQQGLAPAIAEAVTAVESGFNPDAIGGSGEIGLMQVMPATARMLGFSGTNAELAVPETNIRYGVRYLAQAWRLAGGDLCTATMKYRAGHGETRFSHLSVDYCIAVRAKLAARGFPVTGSVPVATFGVPGGGGARSAGCGRRCVGGGAVGRVDLAALNTRLSTLVMQVRPGR